MKPVKWGVISTAVIATDRVIPALANSAICDVYAIASRNAQTASHVAADLNIPVHFASYEDLLADTAIEAVYIPLPNHLHVEWSLRALQAGKHVLCEKPIACSAADVDALIQARDETGLLIEEAFMVRDHPQWLRLKELIKCDRIGTVTNVQLSYSHFSTNPEDIRNQPEFGGGSLLDVGSYCCTIARLIYDAEPIKAMALPDIDPTFGIDRSCSALLQFETGHASFFCSMRSSRYQMVQIVGTSGWIRVEVPFAHPEHLAARLVIGDHEVPGTEAEEIIHFEPVNQYKLQAERFSRQLRDGSTGRWPLETAQLNMRVLDALRSSGETGQWEKV